jgi:hypothetical protein
LGTENEPQYVKINVDLTSPITTTIEELQREFKDVFSWTFGDYHPTLLNIKSNWTPPFL